MTDAFKIVAKTALIVVVTAAVIALFATVQIPTFDTSALVQALSVGLAFTTHWIPIMSVLWPIVLFLLGLFLAEKAFHVAMIAVRWIFKVNE